MSDITIKDISNPNYESNHSVKKKSKGSSKSRNWKIKKANSKTDSKGPGIFDYQSSKNSKYSRKEEAKSKSSKRESDSAKTSKKPSSKNTNKTKSSKCPKPSQKKQGKFYWFNFEGTSKKGSEYARVESDTHLEGTLK